MSFRTKGQARVKELKRPLTFVFNFSPRSISSLRVWVVEGSISAFNRYLS
jgi:hypothetical protein